MQEFRCSLAEYCAIRSLRITQVLLDKQFELIRLSIKNMRIKKVVEDSFDHF